MRDYKEIESEMNRLFDLIEDNPAERKYATSQLKELLNEVESFLIQREMERSVIEELISTKKMILERKQGSQKVRDDAKTDIEDNLEKLRTVKEDIFSFERLRDILDRYLSGTKVFDKYKCFQNIRKLMREKNVKLGQIESEAGVRVGYMSRLEKPENDSEPGILFLVSAAHLLGVTIDELIYSDPSELTEDERYVNEFLLDLIKDTDIHNIQWKKENEKILNNSYFLYNDNTPNHPLLFADDNQFDDDGMALMIRYYSPFYRESKTTVKSCYSASLPDTTSKVYLVWCDIEKNDKDIPDNEFYEVYITDEADKANPICNTLKSASAIGATMNSLYKLAMSDAASVHIDKKTRSIIDTYRRRHQELPF